MVHFIFFLIVLDTHFKAFTPLLDNIKPIFSLTLSLEGTVVCGLAAAKLLQSCPTLCDPIDDSPPGSPIPGILQARILEWVAISFSNA